MPDSVETSRNDCILNQSTASPLVQNTPTAMCGRQSTVNRPDIDLTTGEQFIKEALEIGAIELVPGGRVLKSGRVSPYFFNAGLFNCGSSIKMLGRAYARTIRAHAELRYSVLFGPAYKGITLVTATSMFAADFCLPNEYAYNRKEAKDHGEGGVLVGSSLSGKSVLIIDDVITNGAAKREAVEIIRAAGGTPVGLVIAFDRQERGEGELSAAQEFEEQFAVPVLRVATLNDLIALLRRSGDRYPKWRSALPEVEAYKRQYGVV